MFFTNTSLLHSCILAWKAPCLSFLKQAWKVENQLWARNWFVFQSAFQNTGEDFFFAPWGLSDIFLSAWSVLLGGATRYWNCIGSTEILEEIKLKIDQALRGKDLQAERVQKCPLFWWGRRNWEDLFSGLSYSTAGFLGKQHKKNLLLMLSSAQHLRTHQ